MKVKKCWITRAYPENLHWVEAHIDMGQTTSSEAAMLKSELSRLYQRRLIVDQMIRNLERYSALAVRRPPGRAKKPSGPVMVRRIA